LKKFYLAIVVCFFIFASLVIGFMAAKIYETNMTAGKLDDMTGTSAYFTSAIKENEYLSELRTASVNRQVPALVMKNNIAGEITETWLYVNDGYLCQLVQSPEQSISLEAGTKIIPLESADFIMLGDNLLEITFTTVNNQTCSMNVHIPAVGGGLIE